MIRLIRITAALLVMTAIIGCSRGDKEVATPRPEAYPRIAVYDSIYAPVERLPLRFEANRSAEVTIDSLGADSTAWFTVRYPAYGNAAAYFTVSRTSPDVIANRRERMALNSGGLPSELTELISPGGFTTTVMHTTAGTATPVQILSIGPRYTLSGALFFGNEAKPDSIRPMVEAVRRDMIHAAKTIQ